MRRNNANPIPTTTKTTLVVLQNGGGTPNHLLKTFSKSMVPTKPMTA